MTPHHQHPNDPQHSEDARHLESTPHPNDARQPDDARRPTTAQQWSKDLLAPREGAALLRVNPKTISHRARKGPLDAVPTPGGHRRFPTTEIQAFLRRLEK